MGRGSDRTTSAHNLHPEIYDGQGSNVEDQLWRHSMFNSLQSLNDWCWRRRCNYFAGLSCLFIFCLTLVSKLAHRTESTKRDRDSHVKMCFSAPFSSRNAPITIVWKLYDPVDSYFNLMTGPKNWSNVFRFCVMLSWVVQSHRLLRVWTNKSQSVVFTFFSHWRSVTLFTLAHFPFI